MIDQKNAISIVKNKFKGYGVKKVKETAKVFLFICEAPDRESIPSKMAVAVNKNSGKIGMSITSYDEAISGAS